MSMEYNYQVIVIGAGSAGLVVASGCSALGAKVALIEKNKTGGDCLNTGCVPSKTFLKSAHLAGNIRNSQNYGLKTVLNDVDIKEVMARVKSVIKEIEPNDSKERYEKMGVKVILGEGKLINNHTVKIGEDMITGKYIVIASGSEPMVPPIPGLKEVPYLTNKNIFNLEKLPKHLIVLGGGPIGLELGQGFRYLGSEVSVVDMLPLLFPKDDPEVSPLMEKRLKSEGINLFLSSKIVEVRSNANGIIVIIEKVGNRKEIKGDNLLVSLGRSPISKGIGLEKSGVKLDKKGYIQVNDTLQTSVRNIYACGDVVGPYQFTHMAGYQGSIVVRNVIFPFKSKVDYSIVPWTTYTNPEVAHVGYTEPWARSLGIYNDSVIINLEEIDRARTEGEKTGFLKLILNDKKIVIGATIVGEKAGEMISIATLAIKKKLKATAFSNLIFSYPTESEIFKFASYKLMKKSFKPWMKRIIKSIFLR